MEIDIKDIITLDNNTPYVVVSKVVFENKCYYYLISQNNFQDVLFCEQINDELKEIPEELIKKLLPLFLKSTHEVLK